MKAHYRQNRQYRRHEVGVVCWVEDGHVPGLLREYIRGVVERD